MQEFTGERVIPGHVEPDLWNEHFARYLFAARLARGKRVADLGCGTGYGSGELARTAAIVTGFDVSPDAVAHAREHYSSANLSFVESPCEQVPEPDGSFDLVVSFEVIEHLPDSEALVKEARRLLAPGGQFVVSTPNREYYAESRRASGPNPFHTREFSFAEFRALLASAFDHVTLFTQNHADALVLRPVGDSPGQPVLRVEPNGDPTAAHFFVAVCAMSPQIGAPTFVYLPSSANVLREREIHIERLEQELQTKQQWLDKSLAEHAALVEQFRKQTIELEKSNAWATERDAEVKRLQTTGESLSLAFKSKCRDLDEKVAELGAAVEQLHHTEAELEDRTRWALSLSKEQEQLAARLQQAAKTPWMRLGRVLNLGPDLRP